MKPHQDWGIYTNIIPNNIKIKLICATGRVTNVTMMVFYIFFTHKAARQIIMTYVTHWG